MIDLNNESEADFKEAGLELKTVPLKRNKNGRLVAKERLVIGVIDYMQVVPRSSRTFTDLRAGSHPTALNPHRPSAIMRMHQQSPVGLTLGGRRGISDGGPVAAGPYYSPATIRSLILSIGPAIRAGPRGPQSRREVRTRRNRKLLAA